MSPILECILDARAHLRTARIQRGLADDKIIAHHIDAADRLLGTVIADMRRVPDRVIPLARLDALQGDGPDEAA